MDYLTIFFEFGKQMLMNDDFELLFKFMECQRE